MTRQQKIDALRTMYAGRYMSAYGIAILEDVPDIRPEDTHQIEEIMRDQHPTLDHLDHPTFRQLARNSWAAVQELRADGTYSEPIYAEDLPPEPARQDGFIPPWVLTREQYLAVPRNRKSRYCWEVSWNVATGRIKEPI